jgi:hypothetical protein
MYAIQVLNYVTAPLAACCSTRAPPRASVLLTKKGELPVCNASYKGDIHELQVQHHDPNAAKGDSCHMAIPSSTVFFPCETMWEANETTKNS